MHRPTIVRVCLWVVRACSAIVPRRARREWRMEWEGELHHHARAREGERLDWRRQADLARRTLGALPDAAWVRRQFTADAEIVHDAKHGARLLWRSPTFALSSVGILAVGIGSTVAVVTLLDTLMFRPLPYERAEDVMTLWQRRAALPGDRHDVAPGNFLDWRERSRSFSAMAAAVPYSFDYTGGTGQPRVLFGAQVTEGFWDAIGMRPAVGRAFLPDEHASGSRPVAIVSDRLWREIFGGDPGILDRALSLDGVPHAVVGVLPREFAPQLLPRADMLDVWTVKVVQEHEGRIRASAWWNVVARLAPGVSREAAQAELDAISRTLEQEHPRANAGIAALVIPLREHLMGDLRAPLLVTLAAVILVLTIGCANVASLLLARGVEREREFAIRAAVGAGRARLVRQLVTESLLLSATAAVAGVALARGAVSAIVAVAPPRVLRLGEAAIDERSLLVAVAVTMLTAVGFGVLPALQFSRPGQDAMRERAGRTPRRGFRRGLVAAEVALALVLMTGAGLLVRSFERLTSVDPGFAPEGVVALQVFAWDRNPTAPRIRAFFDVTLERLRALPGVATAGAVSAMPFASANIDIKSPLEIVGRASAPRADQPGTYVTVATPGYFTAMAIPLRAGRLVDDRDTERAPVVALVSDALARREWGTASPLGARLAIQWQGKRVESEIVGVVGQIRHDSLDGAARPEVFFAFAQVPFASMTYVLKGTGRPEALIEAAKREVWAVDPLQTFYETGSVARWVEASVVRQRFSMTLMSTLAGIALLLCATGIYGVISFTTVQRTREIGVRMALGANRGTIQRMVLREGAGVIALGGLTGLVAAVAASRSLRAMLFEIEPGDPLTLAAVSSLVAVVGLAACYFPARRATRIDPAIALRSD
jgi:putative ABC transport system permease protein